MGKKYVFDEQTGKNLASTIRQYGGDFVGTDGMTLEEMIQTKIGLVYHNGNNDGITIGIGIGKEQGFGEGYETGRREGEEFAYPIGKEHGREAEWNAFWDAAQQKGNRTAYQYAFGSYIWNDTNFKPKYDIKPTGTCISMFRYSQITDLCSILKKQGVVLDLSKATNLEYTFATCSTKSVGVVDCTGLSTSLTLNSTFNSMTNLETIELLRVTKNTKYNTTFNGSRNIKSLTMDGVIGQNGFNLSQQTLLTHDSLMSVVNVLEDKTNDTSGTSWVCTLGTTNLAKLTDAEKAIATQKGWSLA